RHQLQQAVSKTWLPENRAWCCCIDCVQGEAGVEVGVAQGMRSGIAQSQRALERAHQIKKCTGCAYQFVLDQLKTCSRLRRFQLPGVHGYRRSWFRVHLKIVSEDAFRRILPASLARFRSERTDIFVAHLLQKLGPRRVESPFI